MKTNELHGAALDYAVAKCVGVEFTYEDHPAHELICFKYSTDWSQGGPLIESYRITIQFDGDGIQCDLTTDDGGFFVGFDESFPLVAAMRCFVASRLGDEVEILEDFK